MRIADIAAFACDVLLQKPAARATAEARVTQLSAQLDAVRAKLPAAEAATLKARVARFRFVNVPARPRRSASGAHVGVPLARW